MVDSFVRQTLADKDKMLDAELLSVGGNPVHRLRTGTWRTDAKSITVSGSGDNNVHTPASGKAVRLAYLSLSADAANASAVVATVKLTGAGSGSPYKVSLIPGAIWARNVGAGQRYLEGDADAVLKVNLSSAQSVHVSTEYGEV